MKVMMAVFALMVLGASIVGASDCPSYKMDPYLAANVDLADDQRAEIRARYEAFMAEINPLRDELFTKKMELRQEWMKENPDQSEIVGKQKEIRAIQDFIEEKAIAYRLQCWRVLTSEQREKISFRPTSYRGRNCGKW